MEENLSGFLDALDVADDGETCFVVEGLRDVAALEDVGVANVEEVDTNLYLFSERVARRYRKAVILTDLDAEGKRLYGKLRAYLSQHGVRLDDKPRDALWRTQLRQVEGLGGYLSRS
ncbi:hypothetical protein KY327_01420 [Candidatus Woesearchaeota archaeon]|nr:hypothetical protein [Candidatus Woesearchaeota archaeon]